MKAKGLLRSLFLLPAFLVAFTSCKSDDPEFGIYGNSFYIVMQEGTMFQPHFMFRIAYGELQSGSITRNSMPLSGKAYPEYGLYQVNPAANAETSLSGLNGTYRLSAESTKGKTAEISGAIEFNSNKALGEINLLSFEYKDGYLEAKVEEVENANYYGFYVEPYIDGKITPIFLLHERHVLVPSASSDGVVSFRMALSSASLLHKVRVTPMAVNFPSQSAGLVFRKAGEGRDLAKGATSFDPVQ